jgi:hypothetical protein
VNAAGNVADSDDCPDALHVTSPSGELLRPIPQCRMFRQLCLDES